MENKKTQEINTNNFITSNDAPQYTLLTIEEITRTLSKLDDILFQCARHPKIKELQKNNRKTYQLNEILELLKTFNEESLKLNMVTIEENSSADNNNHRVTLSHRLADHAITKNPKVISEIFDFLFDDQMKISDIRKLHLLAAFMEKMDATQFSSIFENGFCLYSFYDLQEKNSKIFQDLLEVLTLPQALELLKEWDNDNNDLENSVADFDGEDIAHLRSLLQLRQTQSQPPQNPACSSTDIIKSLSTPGHTFAADSLEEDIESNASEEYKDGTESNNSEPENITIEHKTNGDYCTTHSQPSAFNS